MTPTAASTGAPKLLMDVLSPNGLSAGRRVLLGLALAAGWLMLYGIGIVGARDAFASLWFPPSALTFAALLVVGLRAAPWLLAAIVLVTIWPGAQGADDPGFGRQLLGGLVFGVVHLACYGLGAEVLRRLGRRADHRLPLIVIDFLLIAVNVTLLVSVLGPLALIATGLMPADSLDESWLTFWVGDLVAVIVLAPWLAAVLLRFTPAPRFRIETLEAGPAGHRPRFILRLGVNALVISAAMLLNAALGTLESAFAIFLLLLSQMWLTFSEPPRRTAISTAVNSAIVVGWLFVLDLETFVFVYQFAIAIVATVAYFGVAIPLLAADNSRLRESVMVDRLTGAASREFLERQVAMELQRADRSADRTGSAPCLLVFDLDRFKAINDEFGHAPGDRVLARVHDEVRRVLRSSDVLARFGGDEFVALLPGTEPDVAEEVAERVLEAVRRIEIEDGRRLSASGGLTARRPGDRFETLFERADRALYEAKRAGRDRLRVHVVTD